MITSRHIQPNSFWGLVKQSGPWKTTTVDLTHEANGYDSPHNQVQEVRPYQQDGSAPKLTWTTPKIVDPGNVSFKSSFALRKVAKTAPGRLEKFLTAFIGEKEAEAKAEREIIDAAAKVKTTTLAEERARETIRDNAILENKKLQVAFHSVPGFAQYIKDFDATPEKQLPPTDTITKILSERQLKKDIKIHKERTEGVFKMEREAVTQIEAAADQAALMDIDPKLTNPRQAAFSLQGVVSARPLRSTPDADVTMLSGEGSLVSGPSAKNSEEKIQTRVRANSAPGLRTLRETPRVIPIRAIPEQKSTVRKTKLGGIKKKQAGSP